jgi:hypothetical protein
MRTEDRGGLGAGARIALDEEVQNEGLALR